MKKYTEKRKVDSILPGPIEKLRLGDKRQVLPSSGSKYQDAMEDVHDIDSSDDDSDMEDNAFSPENAGSFMYPKSYIKHIAKKAAAKAAASVKKSSNKKKKTSVWGTAENGGSLEGAVAAVFIHNLKKTVTETDVKRELSKRNVTVISVERKSHQDAYNSSFCILVRDQASHDLLMECSVTPPDVGVRVWRQKRQQQQRNTPGNDWSNSRQ